MNKEQTRIISAVELSKRVPNGGIGIILIHLKGRGIIEDHMQRLVEAKETHEQKMDALVNIVNILKPEKYNGVHDVLVECGYDLAAQLVQPGVTCHSDQRTPYKTEYGNNNMDEFLRRLQILISGQRTEYEVNDNVDPEQDVTDVHIPDGPLKLFASGKRFCIYMNCTQTLFGTNIEFFKQVMKCMQKNTQIVYIPNRLTVNLIQGPTVVHLWIGVTTNQCAAVCWGIDTDNYIFYTYVDLSSRDDKYLQFTLGGPLYHVVRVMQCESISCSRMYVSIKDMPKSELSKLKTIESFTQ